MLPDIKSSSSRFQAIVALGIQANTLWQSDRQSLLFMLTNLGSKGLAALAQLYAIIVFTKMHTQNDAAVIFLLLGYATWFQMLEFGLAQAVQNKFNAKQLTADSILATIIVHYACMLMAAAFVTNTPFLTDILLPASSRGVDRLQGEAFAIGAAMLLISSNNVITQRLLLVANKGLLGNALILGQSALMVIGLACYQMFGHPNLIVAVLVYLGPQVVVFFPIVLRLIVRLIGRKGRVRRASSVSVFSYALSFSGLGILSAAFLGSDYYFAAHYLSSPQIVTYHLATRLFFVSYIAYFAFVQHKARRLSAISLVSRSQSIASILKNSVFIGLASVLAVYTVAAMMDRFGAFNSMTNGEGIGQGLLFLAFLYFVIRVCRDVGLVVALGLNARKSIYKVYALEVAVGLSLMYAIVPIYGGEGIFVSLSTACLLGLALLLQQAKQRGVAFTKS